MDLSQFDTTATADAGAFMQFINPISGAALFTEGNEPIGITFAGTDSERARSYTRKSQNRRLAMAPQRRGKITAEELEEDAIGLLVACAISWQNVSLDGAALEFNEANLRKLLKRFPAFREQADAFIGERGNFLGNGAKA